MADLEAHTAPYPYARARSSPSTVCIRVGGLSRPCRSFHALIRTYNAMVYMDDAPRIGVIGERPSSHALAHGGNGS